MEENNIIMCHLHPLNETCVSFQRMLRPQDIKAASRQIRSQTRKLRLRLVENAKVAFNRKDKKAW